jgi:hypothetical protein
MRSQVPKYIPLQQIYKAEKCGYRSNQFFNTFRFNAFQTRTPYNLRIFNNNRRTPKRTESEESGVISEEF